MSALDMATLEVARVTMFIMALIVRFGVFSPSISQHPEMEWAEDRKVQARGGRGVRCFGAGEMVVLGSVALECLWSSHQASRTHPLLVRPRPDGTAPAPLQGGGGFVSCLPTKSQDLNDLIQMPDSHLPASCLTELGGLSALGSFDRGWPSCSTRVRKLGPSRFRFPSGNAQHPARRSVRCRSSMVSEASLNSTFSYNTSPPRGPDTAPFQDHKRKQSNPTPELSRPLATSTRLDPASWSTTFDSTWAIRESHLICQSVTGALGALGTDSDWSCFRGLERWMDGRVLETDQFQLGQASCLPIFAVRLGHWGYPHFRVMASIRHKIL
ncbi:hypothetical protein NEUTE2DRAFT_136841 [Neurospora tetrasperma FGSC 2509]|nr:hypothetical protein NEUTE2DRAFT_136841 [Neurospora tetrasperma FGSC 2509]